MKQEIEGKTSSGTTHYLVKMLKPILGNNFYTYWINIVVEIIKISYSCMDNLASIISSHNKKVTNSDNKINGKTCNCRNKSKCPLDNKCLTNKIVYKAEVETNDTMSMSYLLKFISVLARQNLSPGTTTLQCHLESGHTKIILNFRNIFGV